MSWNLVAYYSRIWNTEIILEILRCVLTENCLENITVPSLIFQQTQKEKEEQQLDASFQAGFTKLFKVI